MAIQPDHASITAENNALLRVHESLRPEKERICTDAYAVWFLPDRLMEAVDRVSFELQPGRTLGIVGESGCGKSMLARAIMGLPPTVAAVSPTSAVEFNGRNLIGMPGKLLRRIIGREIAMIFLDPMTTLNPVMTVGRQVAEVVRHHLKSSREASTRRTHELLEQVGIPMAAQRADQYPHHRRSGHMAMHPPAVENDPAPDADDLSGCGGIAEPGAANRLDD